MRSYRMTPYEARKTPLCLGFAMVAADIELDPMSLAERKSDGYVGAEIQRILAHG
jgi:hypothetical protein